MYILWFFFFFLSQCVVSLLFQFFNYFSVPACLSFILKCVFPSLFQYWCSSVYSFIVPIWLSLILCGVSFLPIFFQYSFLYSSFLSQCVFLQCSSVSFLYYYSMFYCPMAVCRSFLLRSQCVPPSCSQCASLCTRISPSYCVLKG